MRGDYYNDFDPGAVLAINGANQARSATERAATAPQAPSTIPDTPQPQAPSLRRGYERTPL